MRRLVLFAAAPAAVLLAFSPVTATPLAGAPGGTLPRTGAALASLAGMALLAVIAGPLLRLATRRQARMVA
jgi:hypothetical protein